MPTNNPTVQRSLLGLFVMMAAWALGCSENKTAALSGASAATSGGDATVDGAVGLGDVAVAKADSAAVSESVDDGPVDTGGAILDQPDAGGAPELVDLIDLPPNQDSTTTDGISAELPATASPCAQNSDCPPPTEPCLEARCEAKTATCKAVFVIDGSLCSDSEPCTVGDSCQKGACVAGKLGCGCKTAKDCGLFDDGNLCNGQWICDLTANPSVCASKPGSKVTCPASTSPCSAPVCNPVSGACDVTAVGDGSVCEDGKACTSGDTCGGGLCIGGPDACLCKKNSDCTDDGDACNGLPYCDKSELPWSCKLNPGTVLTCSPASDTACLKNTCNALTGTCGLLATNSGGACQDGDSCTVNDLCAQGLCTPGTSKCGCVINSDCAKLDDGNGCNGSLFCNVMVTPHVCQTNPATVVVCPTAADSACKANQCDPKSAKCGFVLAKDSSPCDDGNPCTSGDGCDGGACIGGTKVCSCATTADCAASDDGDLCNGTLFCNKSKLPYQCEINPQSLVTCPSVGDTACLKNSCVKASGQCAPQAINASGACDADGQPCTGDDHCQFGLCVAGTNTCLCKQDSDCKSFEDGNACNGSLFCDKMAGKCVVNPNTVVVCSPANDTFCLANSCIPLSGTCALQPRNQGQTCDADANPCTAGDSCDKGVCSVGTNTCTCQTTSNCTGFEDGNACNGSLFCDKTKVPFVCAVNPATVIECGTGSPPACQKNQCNPKMGKCEYIAVTDYIGCDDGQICTVGDVCTAGKCAPGANLCQCVKDLDCAPLEDGNSCNGSLYCDKSKAPFLCKVLPISVVVCNSAQDLPCVKAVCQSQTGACSLAPVAVGAACNDDNACTGNDACANGDCNGNILICNDNNACSVDLCDAIDGCLGEINAAAACDDSNGCTVDACDAKQGCSHSAVSDGLACSDNNPCTISDSCGKGACAGQKGGSCDDGNPCTDDTCAPTGKSCSHIDNSAPCANGRSCSQGRCGGCQAWFRVVRKSCAEVLLTTGTKAGVAKACEWVGTKRKEELQAAIVLTDGRLLAVGAAGADNVQATQGWAVWHSPSGVHLAENVYGVAGLDRFLGAAPAPAAGAWLVGASQGQGAVLRPWLVRVDASGTQLSQQLLAPPLGTLATDKGSFDGATAMADGGVVAVGSIENASNGSADAVVARFDGQGKLLWSSVFGKESSAQTPQIDRLLAVVALAGNAGIVAAGHRGIVNAPAQQHDGWLLRLTTDGQSLWSKTFGGKTWDALGGVTQAANGDLLAVGTTAKATSAAAGEGWLLRVSTQGTLLQQTQVAGSHDDALHTVTELPGGDLLTGGTQSINFTGNSGWTSYDRGNGWAVRLAANGSVKWQRSFDQHGDDRLRGGAVLPGGDLFLVGDTRGPLATSAQDPDYSDGFALRVDAQSGESSCSCGFFTDLPTNDVASQLSAATTLTSDGVVAVGGWMASNGLLDGWLRAVEADGTVRWNHVLDRQGSDQLWGVAKSPQGILAVGETTSLGSGKRDGWLVLFDDVGKIVADFTAGGAEDDWLNAAAPLPGGGFVAAGGSFTASVGKDDGWLVAIGPDNKVLWEYRFGTAGSDQFKGVTVVGSGNSARILAVGFGKTAAGDEQIAAVLDMQGKVQTGKSGQLLAYSMHEAKSNYDRVFAVAARLDGSAWAPALLTALNQLAIVRFDGAGERQLPIALNYHPLKVPAQAIVILPDGGALMAGHQGPYADGSEIASAWRVDAAGAVVAWPSHLLTALAGKDSNNGINSVSLRGLIVTAAGSVIATGTRTDAVAKSTTGLVVRIDPGTGLIATTAINTACENWRCDATLHARKSHLPQLCDDAKLCTSGESCSAGACVHAPKLSCDDGSPCTTDTCIDNRGCQYAAAAEGLSCTASTLCAAGNCGMCTVDEVSWPDPTGHVGVAGATAAVGGGWWLAGNLAKSKLVGPYTGAWWRLDASGAVVASGSAAANTNDFLIQPVAMDNGGAWLAGISKDQTVGGADKSWLVQVDAQGMVLQTELGGKTGKDRWYSAVRSAKSDQFAVVGWRTDRRTISVRKADGQIVAESSYGYTKSWASAVAASADGGYWVGGVDGAFSSSNRVTVDRFDSSGKLLTSWWYEIADHTGPCSVLPLPDGGVAMIVNTIKPFNGDALLLRMDAAGTLLVSKQVFSGSLHEPISAILMGSTIAVAVRTGQSWTNRDAMAVGIDLNGKIVWTAAPPSTSPSEWSELLLQPDGRIRAIGTKELNSARRVWTRTLSAKGELFCGPPLAK
ncbi:MAG: hypothetical protein EXR77_05700 [Myxococcales bacterium]|nr:hypothetical protein [Myxococcales bacterium]